MKKKMALILNIAIVIVELIGFGYTLMKEHSIAIEYYTNDSNLLALFSSLLYIVFYGKNKEFVKDLRFITTNCLTVTFLVVVFILSPMFQFNYKLLMFTNIYFLFHTLSPILSFISYAYFEEKSKKTYKGILFTILYAIIIVILNIIGIVTGPYPFLKIKEQSIIMTLLWGMIIIGGNYLISLAIQKINTKRSSK